MSSEPLTPHKNFIGAVKDEWQLYSDHAEDYTLGLPIGFGSSSIVYHAIYHPKGSQEIECALKVLDLDRLPQGSLRLLQRETQLMSLSKHPNVLRVRGSWMDGHKLHIALRLMIAGSAADVMRYGWPGGMEEEVVRCILKQALEGLNYLHINGFIHRDIKAANLLIDNDGTVLLGDLGVAAPLHDEDHNHADESSRLLRTVVFDTDVKTTARRSRVGKRRSFVGTPCWMAPELISGMQYDSSADIWSFGITALELAQGRAPRSRESSRTVLLQTVQAAPPTLDREGGVHKYSRAFKEIVESCLVKEPSRRPTAAQLLQTSFFKNAKKPSYLVGAILRDLPPLAQRLERQKQATIHLHGTVDSWDFPATVHASSPTTSAFRPPWEIRAGNHEDPHEHSEKHKAWSGHGADSQTDPSDTESGSPETEESDAAPGGDAASTASESDSPPPTDTLSPRANVPTLPSKAPASAPATSPVAVSVCSSANKPATGSSPPSPSLWRRLRSSTAHTAESVRTRTTLVSAVLGRGKAGGDGVP